MDLPEKIDEEINREIWKSYLSKCPFVPQFERFYSTERSVDALELYEIFYKLSKLVDAQRPKIDIDGFVVDSNGILRGQYGNATLHDYLVWRVQVYEKNPNLKSWQLCIVEKD